MKIGYGLILGLVLHTICLDVSAANKALLVGVGEYEGDRHDLDGPPVDVVALKEVLIKYWQFEADNISTLMQYDATKANVVKALKQLSKQATADDSIFIYYSGHGTSVHDKALGLPLPDSSGALIPTDFPLGGDQQQQLTKLIIGKRDLRPIFTELDNTGAQITVAFDTCYSGNTVRGAFASNRLPTRNLDADLEFDDGEENISFSSGLNAQQSEPYPYKNVFFLAAASARETATDINQVNIGAHPTLDNQPHGAFTDALLRALSGNLDVDINKDDKINYAELFQSVKTFMHTRGYHHTPQALPQNSEDERLLHFRPVFNQQAPAKPKPSSTKPTDAHTDLLTVTMNFRDDALTALLKQLAEIRLVSSAADVTIQKQGNVYRLVSKAGDVITTLHRPQPKTLLERIRQEAWKTGFDRLLQQHVSFNTQLSLLDSLAGNTARNGDKIAFTLRSEKKAYLLLLDVFSDGSLNVLYPQKNSELNAIPAKSLTYIPGKNPNDLIVIQPPFGTDHLIAIAFNQKPAFFAEFIKQEQLSIHDGLYKKLQAHLKTAEYGFSVLDVLTVDAP